MQTLWGETKTRRPRRRRKRNRATRTSTISYSITGSNDCAIIGHTLNHWSLAGTNTCMDCGKSIFCPQCIPQHPNDPQAEALLCEQHEERTVKHAI